MTETEHYKLKKPEGGDYVGPGAFNENAEAIDAALHGLETGKAGLGADGKVPVDQLPEMDYEGPLKGVAAKETPADADGVVLVDAGDQKTKKLLWSRVKAVLKGWFDTLYAAAGHTHTAAQVGARPSTWVPAWGDVTGKPAAFAPSAHTHGAGDITSGALGLSRGGTGATTAAAARAALGACAEFAPVTVTVSTAWSGSGPWYKTVTVSGVTAAMTGIGVYPVDITDTAARKLYNEAYGCLAAEAETVAGGIKLYCRDKKPAISFQIKIQGVKP